MLLEAVFSLEDVAAILTHTRLLITHICWFAWSSGPVAQALLTGKSALLWMTPAFLDTLTTVKTILVCL
jgi:hypothetical protein